MLVLDTDEFEEKLHELDNVDQILIPEHDEGLAKSHPDVRVQSGCLVSEHGNHVPSEFVCFF